MADDKDSLRSHIDSIGGALESGHLSGLITLSIEDAFDGPPLVRVEIVGGLSDVKVKAIEPHLAEVVKVIRDEG